MAQYEAHITITLRPSILDPQGKATSHALDQLGFDAVDEVRIGKNIRLRLSADSSDAARAVAREACEKLLANPVMEDYNIEIREAELASS